MCDGNFLKKIANRYSWQFIAFHSLACFLGLGAYFIPFGGKAGIAPEAALLEASGTLVWVQEYKYGTRFGLAEIAERFDYPFKANRMGDLRDALKRSGGKVVNIRYESETHGGPTSDEKYHNVWKVSVGGRTIRTYEQTATAWEEDKRTSRWLNLALTACGVLLGYTSWRVYRVARPGVQRHGFAAR